MNFTFYDNIAYILIILVLIVSVIIKYLCDYKFKCQDKN